MTPTRPGDASYPIDVTFMYSGHAADNDYTMIEHVYQPDGSTVPVTRGAAAATFAIQEGRTEKSIDIKAVDDLQIERLNESLVITVTGANWERRVIHDQCNADTMEPMIRDNDKLELEAIQFIGIENLRSDPFSDDQTSYDWYGTHGIVFHWHSDRILGADPGAHYVPLAYASSKKLTGGGWWKPADVDPAIENDLFMFFEVDINGVQYSNAIKLQRLPSGKWRMLDAARLSSSFAALQGQMADYRAQLRPSGRCLSVSRPMKAAALIRKTASRRKNKRRFVTAETPRAYST